MVVVTAVAVHAKTLVGLGVLVVEPAAPPVEPAVELGVENEDAALSAAMNKVVTKMRPTRATTTRATTTRATTPAVTVMQ